jgi:hypothetical protein
MRKDNITEITLESWHRLARKHVRTLSGRYLPLSSATAYHYECDSSTFLTSETYIVRYTDPQGTSLVPYNDPSATAITFRDFAKNGDFAESVLADWYDPAQGPIQKADAITHHCVGCDRRVVIDGIHRLTWLAKCGTEDALLRVAELSGVSWPDDMPDMAVVCACIRKPETSAPQ